MIQDLPTVSPRSEGSEHRLQDGSQCPALLRMLLEFRRIGIDLNTLVFLTFKQVFRGEAIAYIVAIFFAKSLRCLDAAPMGESGNER